MAISVAEHLPLADVKNRLSEVDEPVVLTKKEAIALVSRNN